MTIKIKLFTPKAQAPTRATNGAVGYDLYATHGIWLASNSHVRVDTGFGFEIPHGYEGQVRGRSSLAAKGILTHPGTIDSDYRGSVSVILFNHSFQPHQFAAGDRIGQIVFTPVVLPELQVVNELDSTDRGTGGFGSTGT
jgi:dUTP pyrophosphatase